MGRNFVGFAFVLACFLPLVFSQVLRANNRQCRPSIFYRPRSCGNFLGRDCRRRGCCFRPFYFNRRRGTCFAPTRNVIGLPYYRVPETEIANRNPSPPIRHVGVGGVIGYPGSTIRVFCLPDSQRRLTQAPPPCGHSRFNTNPSECERGGCCWSPRFRCIRPTYNIIRLRNKCEPGFKNPPKCEDIDECTSNVTTRCQNQGSCTDLINSYSCDCQGAISGTDCTEVCRDPPVVNNSNNTYQGIPLNTNQTVTYTCDAGFRLVGNAVVTCEITQTYTNPPTCVRACTASSTSPPRNPSVLFSPTQIDYIAGEIVTYSCSGGITLSPNVSTNECVNGAWIRPSPECFSCGPPPLPVPNGFVTAGNNPLYMEGQVVIYQCLQGSVLVGSANNTCLSNGAWSEAPPLCDTAVCPVFLPVVNGSVDPLVATQFPQPLNTTVTVTCNTGYFLSPPRADFTCQQANNAPPQYFPAQAPACFRGCSFPTSNLPGNATFTPSQAAFTGLFPQGAPIFIACDSGFTISGPRDHACQPESNPQFPTLISNPTVCQPNCPLVSSLTFPANSNVSTVSQVQDSASTMPVGTVATFTCNAGYRLDGTDTITCLSTGTYSAFIFSCIRVCANSPITSNSSPGSVSLIPLTTNGTTPGGSPPYDVGSRFIYSCQNSQAFTLTPETSNVTTCLNTGAFSLDSSPPTCEQIACASPPGVANADFAPMASAYSTNDVITYQCNSDFVLMGSNMSSCMANFSWSLMNANLPSCLRSCGNPPSTPSLSVTLSMGSQVGGEYVAGNIIDYSCMNGQISMSTINFCQNSGAWNVTAASLPSCNPYCNISLAPTAPSDGSSFIQGSAPYVEGASVVYSCNLPTHEINPDTVNCQLSGNWLPSTIGSCMQTSCGQPILTNNNSFVNAPNSTYPVGTSLTYMCNSGFGRLTASTSVCETNFTWTLDANPPSCSRICPSPPPSPTNSTSNPVTNGSVTFFEGDTISYLCDLPTQSITSDNQTVCQINGLFSPAPIPSCQTVRCGTPVDINNGTIDLNGNDVFEDGVTLTYTCDSGFSSRLPLVTTCQSASSFSFSLDASSPMCLEECPPPPAANTNSVIDPSVTPYLAGDTILYQCNGDLVYANTSVIGTSSCQSNAGSTATWSLTTPPVCYCNSSSFPQHNGTTPQGLTPPIAVGQMITYMCEAGQAPRGSQTNQCNATGIWINTPPTCENVCSGPPSIANGSIVTSSSASAPYFADDRITYQCDTGFIANDPDNLINTCLFGSPNSWQRDSSALFSVCRPDANFVLLLTKTTLGSCSDNQLFPLGQRNFVNDFQTSWGSNAITQGPSQIAVGFYEGFSLITISPFSDSDAIRISKMNTFTVPSCGSFSPGVLIFAAQSAYANLLNESIPTYYLLLIDITTPDWIGPNENTAVTDLTRATTPIENVVFPIAVTSGTSQDAVAAFFNKYYTTPGNDLQSVTPGLYFDATASGVTMTSIIDDIVTHCKINNC